MCMFTFNHSFSSFLLLIVCFFFLFFRHNSSEHVQSVLIVNVVEPLSKPRSFDLTSFYKLIVCYYFLFFFLHRSTVITVISIGLSNFFLSRRISFISYVTTGKCVSERIVCNFTNIFSEDCCNLSKWRISIDLIWLAVILVSSFAGK